MADIQSRFAFAASFRWCFASASAVAAAGSDLPTPWAVPAPVRIGDDATVRIGSSLHRLIFLPFELAFGVAADVDDRCNVCWPSAPMSFSVDNRSTGDLMPIRPCIEKSRTPL